MKKIIFYAGFSVYFFLCLLFWQCSSSPTAPEPRLSLSEQSLTFEAGETQKVVTISNSGGGELTWSAQENPDQPWLSISPDSGQAGVQMTITIDPTLLNPGSHTGSIRITSNDGDQDLPLTVLISKLSLSVPMIVYESSENSKPLEIRNLGAGKLNWNISKLGNLPWLEVNPTSGENNMMVTVTVDRSGVNTGSYFGALVISSTGGIDTVSVAMSKLPSSIFLDEFSGDLSNWTVTNATGKTNNGLLELTGTSSTRFGVASHDISPVRAAPWLYRLAVGRKNSLNSAVSSMVMETNDVGTIIIFAYRFDLISDSDANWAAGAFLLNTSTFQGGWALLEDDAKGLSQNIKIGPDELNDISWAMKPSKDIEIYVDGTLFYQSDILNQINIGIIGVSLESVNIWASDDLTTIADWALVRDVDIPGNVLFSVEERHESRLAIMEFARQEAFRRFKDGTWKQMPTLKQLYEQIR
ncbi:MAG: BACON domain-containing protein [bacterium]